MKEMIYKAGSERIILEKARYKGFEYCILSLGTHPCAYIRLPDSYNSKNYTDIDCHGGITYNEDCLWVENSKIEKGNWIGWDYAHYNDYVDPLQDIFYNSCTGKKWSTKEIISECECVINQIIKINKINEISFRGKRIDNNKWIYGYYFFDNFYKKGYITVGNHVMLVNETDNHRIVHAFEVDPLTVGRYTSLTDKNGRKIFEGDVVIGRMGYCGSPDLPIKENKFVVKYSNGCYNELHSTDYYEFEVIGNIYDNPELLKGCENNA